MKKRICLTAAALLMICTISACKTAPATTGSPETTPQTTTSIPLPTTTCPPQTTQGELPTQPQTTPPTTVPETTAPVVLTGWQELDGKLYYFVEGEAVTGWQQIEDGRYYFSLDGVMQTGWLLDEEGLHYLAENGMILVGWQQINGLRYCFDENGVARIGWYTEQDATYFLDETGAMASGWLEWEGKQYYLDAEGILHRGWLTLQTQTYYMDEQGAMVTGWQLLDQTQYYFKPDGTIARGCVEIDGVKNYFTSSGVPVLLVNPWNFVPEGYDPQLVKLDRFGAYTNMQVAQDCYEPLMKMLSDCKAAGHKTYVVSAYRTQEAQEKNFQRKVQQYLDKGYSEEDAKRLAATVVAVPGTSEHQLGLAVDIVDASWPYLEEEQAKKPAQKWLMEHCWEYGFILRYPKEKTDVTGIIYEPWHYRYVGVELAKQLHESGLTLEEYLAALTEPTT